MSDIMKDGVFDWDVFKDRKNKIAVHLKTQEECDEFSKMLDEHGMKWCDGLSYLKCILWDEHKENTCYANNGMYTCLNYYKKNYYHILEFSDYFSTEKETETKQEGESNMNNITVNMENLKPEEREQLLKLIEKANKKDAEPKVWKPKDGDKYYFIDSSKISSYDWTSHDVDKKLYAIGNCFRTEEKAKFAIEKLKVIVELKRFAQEHNKYKIDWNSDQDKYSIYFDTKEKTIDIDYNIRCKANDIYFTSREIARAAIEAIGEVRLKKYYFEVKD